MFKVLHTIDIVAICSGLVCAGLWLRWHKKNSQGLPHLPGPPGLPLIGNILDMPERDEWEEARKWGKKYGTSSCRDIFYYSECTYIHLILKHTVGNLVYIENFGTPFLFVNSAEAAYELFVKRGVNYSSRPNMTMVNLCVLVFIITLNVVSYLSLCRSGWDWLLGIMPYGEEHRKVRLQVHRYFQSNVVNAYYDIHTQAARQLLARLSHDPEGFLQYTRQ